MRYGHRPLVNPATSSKAELPAQPARVLARKYGELASSIADAALRGDGAGVADITRQLDVTRYDLVGIVEDEDASPASRTTAARALGLPDPAQLELAGA